MPTLADTSPYAVLGGPTGLTMNDPAHTHTVPDTSSTSGTTATAVATWGTASDEPDRYTVIYIQSDGTPYQIPDGAIVWYDQASPPTGWTKHAGSTNKFFKGAAAGADGGTSTAAAAHSHAVVNHSHGHGTHTHTTPLNSNQNTPTDTVDNNPGQVGIAFIDHVHAITIAASASSTSSDSAGSGGTSQNEPPWYKLQAIENTSGGLKPIVQKFIAMWLGTLASIPDGWKLCDGTNSTPDLRGKFIKNVSATGEIGNTGGTSTHSHSSPSAHGHGSSSHTHVGTVGTPSTTVAIQSNAVDNQPAIDHVHQGTVTSGSASPSIGTDVADLPSANGEPSNRTVAYIQWFSDLALTIDSPTDGATVTAPTFLVDWSFTSGSGTQNDYRVKVYKASDHSLVYDSGQTTSATTSHTVPNGYIENSTDYEVEVTVHDTGSPAETGVKMHEISTSWTLPTTISGLTLTPVGGT